MSGLWPCRNNRKAAKYAAARAIAKERRIAMPTETAITVAGIIIAFAVFAVSLAWADFYTRNVRTPGATYFRGPK
jgi:hypothetical protein